MVLFKLLLLIFLGYLVLRFIGRVLLGFSGSQRSTRGNFNSQKEQRGKEGDVFIKYNSDKDKKFIRKDDGEYVKFEELDDE